VNPTEVLARLGSDNPPTDEELREALAEFKTLGKQAVAANEPEETDRLKQAVGIIEREQKARADAEAERAAKAAADLVAFQDEEEEAEEEEPEAEEAEEDEVEAKTEAELSALEFAVKNNRARIDAAAVPENPYPNVQITGLGQAAQVTLGHESRVKDVAQVFAQYARGRNRGRDTFVRMAWDYGERTLGDNTEDNARLVDSVLGENTMTFEAIAAAGGICGPLDTVFDIPLVGSRGRPVRDALTRFGADRGGVRYIAAPRPSQGTFNDGVAVWTSANDASPTSPAEKPCPHIDCDTICEVEVGAITACLVVGNFQARFSPEQWANALGLLGIRHDRIAEQNLLAGIDAGSIAATFASASGGTIGNVLGAVDRAVAAIRSRERLSEATGFRLLLDAWLRPALRAQFTVQAPAGQTGAPGLADQAVNAWFAARGVTVTYTGDDSIFATQTAGELADFPSETTLRLFPEGTWWFLDGGTLDLGTEIVDSTLIAQNDRQAFMETFEGVAKRTAPCDAAGDDSLSITVGVSEDCLDACAVTSP
jgi:hypothetical protein